jgi:hypothetical protein
MKAVKSKAFDAIGYDAGSNTLRVQFASGAIYEVEGITGEEHSELLAAQSMGKHWQKHLRDREARRIG